MPRYRQSNDVQGFIFLLSPNQEDLGYSNSLQEHYNWIIFDVIYLMYPIQIESS